MSQHLVSLMGQYGLLIVIVNVLLDQIGLPIPAVPTLIVAGAMAAEGGLSASQLTVGAVLACVTADCIWYFVGQRYGISVLKTLCRISLEPDSCVSETQSRFERWGVRSLLVARFVPGLSVIAPPMAGAMRIGWPKYLVFSTAGALLWVAAGLGAGMLFRTQIHVLLANLWRVGGAVGLTLGCALAAYVTYKWWQRRRFLAALRMARIGVSALYDLMSAGAAPIIIDVRPLTARALEPRWIPGAIHVPLNDIGGRVTDLPRDREIVVYCTCPSEASAARVAKILINNGFKTVRPLHGGLDAWIAAGYVVEGKIP